MNACAKNKRAVTNRPVSSSTRRTTDLSRPAVCQDHPHTIQRGSSKRRKRKDYSVLSRQCRTKAQPDGSLPRPSYGRATRGLESRSAVTLLGCKSRRWPWTTVATQTNFADSFSRMNEASSITPLKTEVSLGCFFTYYANIVNLNF